MTKLLIPIALLAFFGGCLNTGCMPTEQSEQMRWKQAQDSDAAERASVRATMEELRKADAGEHKALSTQITEEHKIQTPEKMDALAGMQAQFQSQMAAIMASTQAAVAAANKAADDRVAAVIAENGKMPKNPMGSEALTAIGTIIAAIAGSVGLNKLSPNRGSSLESATKLAALEAKIATKPT